MPEIGDMVQCRFVGTFDGEPIINTFSFVAVVPFGTWRELAIAMHAEIVSGAGINLDLVGGRSSQYHLSQLQVVDVYPGTSPLIAFTLNDTGTVTDDDAMPPNDCLCVTMRSDFKGPGGRGRVYLTGFAEGAANGGYWEAGTQTAAETLMGDLDGSFGEEAGGASFRWAILHRYAGGSPLVPPEVKPVMSWTVHNEVRSLGRRAVGRRIRRHRTPAP